jgi:outer membrane usher protein
VFAAALSGGFPCLAFVEAAPVTPTSGKIVRTIADWMVNQNTSGDTFAVFKAGELYVPSTTVAAFGAYGLPAGKHFRYSGDDYVSLDSLRPDLTYAWDENDHEIAVTIAPSHFLPTAIEFRERPSGIGYQHATSGFVNYDLHESVDGKQRATSLALDSSLTLGPGDFSLVGSLADARFSTSSFSYAVNDPARLTQVQLGQVDQNARTVVPGTPIGLSFGRKFQLDPYLDTAPIPSLTTAVNSPSTVYVYVNGRLIKTQKVAPGILDLSGIPMTGGTNDATVIIAGPDGRRTLDVPFYGASGNLAKGLTDFQFEAALEPTAHVPVFSAFYRRGLTNAFTQDVALVSEPGYGRAGSALDLRTPIGVFHASYDQSRQNGNSGGSVDLRYSFSGSRFTLGAEAIHTASGFTTGLSTVGPSAMPSPPALAQLNESLYLGLNARNVTPYLRWQNVAGASQSTSSTTLGTGIRLGRGSLTLAATRQGNPRGTSFSATFSTQVGRASATESYDSSTHTSSLTAETSRRDGTGYTTLTADVPSLDQVQLDSNASWSKGAYALSLSRAQGSLSGDLDYEGAVGFVGDRVFESKPIDEGFALVRVPGLAGVDVSLEGRPEGRTDGRGDLLIPGLITGFANTVTIDEDDLPLDLHFDKTQQVVSPLGRSGMMVEFPYSRVHAFRGQLLFLIGGRQVVPINGVATYRAHGEENSVDVSDSGQIYFEDIEPGSYPLHLEADNGVCDVTVTIPKTDAAFAKFGPVTCTPQ